MLPNEVVVSAKALLTGSSKLSGSRSPVTPTALSSRQRVTRRRGRALADNTVVEGLGEVNVVSSVGTGGGGRERRWRHCLNDMVTLHSSCCERNSVALGTSANPHRFAGGSGSNTGGLPPAVPGKTATRSDRSICSSAPLRLRRLRGIPNNGYRSAGGRWRSPIMREPKVT